MMTSRSIRSRSAASGARSTAHSRLEQGDERVQDGRWKAAAHSYTRSLHKEPSAAAWSGRAVARWYMGDRDGALRDIDRALDKNPEDPRALVWSGHTTLVMGSDLSVACGPLRTAHRINPNDEHALFQLALTHTKRGADDDALPLLNQLLEHLPNHVRGRLLRSDCHARARALPEGLADVDAVLATDPTNVDALARRGNLLVALGRSREGLRDYAAAGHRRPEAARAFHSNPDNRELLRQALAQDSCDEFAAQLDADMKRHLRYWEIAARGYDKVISRNPNNVDAWAGRADVSLDRRNSAYAFQIKDDLREALRLDPNHPLALAVKADYLRIRGRHNGAVRTYDRALANGAGARALVGKAKSLAHLDAFRDAHRTVDRLALLGDQYGPLASQQRGFLYLSEGSWSRASRHFSRAITANDNDHLSYAGRGEAQRKRHQYKHAIADFNIALSGIGNYDINTYQLAYAGREKAEKSLRRRPLARFFSAK